MRIGLFEQIFSLVYFVGCINRNKNSAYFYGCPECQVPLRYICRPNRNVVTRTNAERNEHSCDVIDVLTKFSISSCIIKGGIFERVLVRKTLSHFIKNL